MRKLKLFFACLLMTVLSIGQMWGADEVYKTALFGAAYNSTGTNGYTDVSFSSTNNGFTVNVSNANTYNNNWDYIKIGGKKGAYTGTITTADAIDKAITKVEMSISAITASNVTSITLYSSANGSSWASEGTFTKATGTQSVSITSPTENLYYKIEVVCTKGSANGLITIAKVDYYKAMEAGVVGPVSFSPESESFLYEVEVSLSQEDNKAIYYTTDDAKKDNPDVDTWTLYNSASKPTFTETTTVYAAAVEGSTWSEVTEKTFTKATVLSVAEARAAINQAGSASIPDQYVAGVISKIDSYNSTYHSITYWISDDGTTTDQLQVYSGLAGVVKNAFTSKDDIAVGADVIIKGSLKKYGSTYEFDLNNVIVEYSYKPTAQLSWNGVIANAYSADIDNQSANEFPTLENTNSVSVSYISSNPEVATINASTGEISLVAVGATTITATFAGNDYYKANSASYTLNVASSILKADISFEENGGSEVADLTAQTNLPNPLPVITKAGKNFGGWYKDSEFNTLAVAGAAVESNDPITLYAKWLEPYTVADALAIIGALADNASTDNQVYVSGIISQVGSYNGTYHSITYWISADGTTTDQIQVYGGLIGNAATPLDKEAFDAADNLVVGDVVTIYGTLKKYVKNETTTPEFDKNNTIYSFNRPVVASISADPVAVDAAAHAAQSVTITYENWGTVNVADADATLFDDADCTIAFSGEWINNVSLEAPYSSVSFDIAANTGEARTAYMKIYALGDDATTAAEKVIAIAQEEYVAPAEPAELPFAFDGGRDDIASKQGMSQEGLDTDYASSPKLKFNSTGDVVIINIASDPGKLTYDIKGNSFSGGTFKVQESADGENYTDVATYTELNSTQSEEKTLAQTTRYVKFIYTTKDAGNVALGNIAIAEYVAPAAVETPTFTVAEGLYLEAQSVEIECATDGAEIRYTMDGNDPDENSTLYDGAIAVSTTTTIKAIAIKGSDESAVASATYTIVTLEHAGTADDPYTVADARTAIDAGVGLTNVYATGIVSEIVTAYNSQYGNISYNISADGETTSDQLQAFRGKNKDGEWFTSENDVKVGDVVVVYGSLKKYEEIYEFAQDNQRYSFQRPGDPVLQSIEISEGPSKTTYDVGDVFDVTGLVVTGTYDQGDPAAIASGITWEVRTNSTSDAVALESYTLALNQTALQVRATVSAIASEWYDVTGLTVKEHEITPGAYDIVPNNTFFSTEANGSITGEAASLTYTGTQNDITITYAKGTQSNMYINATQTRVYNGSVMGFSVPAGYVIKAIAFTAGGNNWAGTHTASEGSMTDNKNWSGTANSVTITFGGTCRITSIKVTFAEYVPATVATPTFSPAGGEYTEAKSVELSCATEGATIYYTTDGNDPDNTSTPYTSAIAVDESMTIKAIAYKDAEYSEVATAIYTINIVVAETPVSTTSKWVPATEITDGMQVLIVGAKNGETYAIGTQASNNRSGVAASVDGEGVLTPGDNTMAFTLVAAGATNTYYIKTSNNQYLYNASSSTKSYLRTKAEQEDVSWTIELDGDNNAVITSVENTNRQIMRFNYNGGSTLFNCYASGQDPIKLYVPKQETPEPQYETVRENLAANRYYTLCFNRTMDAVQGATFWSFASKDADVAYLVQEDAPYAAGKPYIIYAEAAGDLTAVLSGEEVTTTVANGALYGTFAPMGQAALDAAGENIYLLMNNQLRRVDGQSGNNLPAYRAYIDLDEIENTGAPANVPAHRVRAIPMQPQTATGIGELNLDETPMKLIINGQLIIIRGEKMFNANGQLVK